MNLEEKKAQALKNYKEKRDAYMETISRENWIAFCDAKRVCRLMGVRKRSRRHCCSEAG